MSKSEQQELIERLVTDLVQLSVKTHKVIINSQIPASYAPEAHEILLACESIYNEFVKKPTKKD